MARHWRAASTWFSSTTTRFRSPAGSIRCWRRSTQHPGTGLAGSQLVYPDGRLQEAGGVVRNDGRADNLGRLRSAQEPEFSYVRRVDYCWVPRSPSAADLFAHFGGFDSHYAPAYYEDTDLAMKVANGPACDLSAGLEVVLHLEGVTSGTDTRRGVKRTRCATRRCSAQRWASRLASHPDHEMARPRLIDTLLFARRSSSLTH